MISTVNLSDAVHVVSLLVGLILLLKRVADMDRYYTKRLLILTTVLSSFVIWFVLAYGLPQPFDDCFDFGSVYSRPIFGANG